MFIDQHPYLSIYFLGSLLVILLTFVKIVFFYIINWTIKANIINKNLEKLSKPDDKAWYLKFLSSLGVLLVEAALSWINVVVVLGQMIYETVKILRDLLTSVPEEIKKLRFPLKNNPMLSKEAVWAYSTALYIKIGQALPNENVIIASIEDVLDNRPDFNYQIALDHLDSLNVVNSEIIASVRESFIPKDNESKR